jgi:hypothetical protein
MGNCENVCRKSDAGKHEIIGSKTGDKLEDSLNQVIDDLEHDQSGMMGRRVMHEDKPTEESYKDKKDIVRVEPSKNGKTLVQFENGGVYEGRLR